jgi:hypothetical protein
VTLRVAEKPDALTVPRNAVVDRAGEKLVFIADGQIARARTVETGIESPELVEVTAGLQEGEIVVTVGAAALSDGDAIVVPEAGTGRVQ